MHTNGRRRLTLRWIVFAALTATTLASAAGYPDKPVKVVVGFAPGGPTDVVARAIFAKVAEQTGQTFVIENRPGGNSNIAMRAVQAAEPDGYTLLYATSSTATNPGLYRSPEFDIRPKLSPVILTVSIPFVILVPGSSTMTTPTAFVEQLKAQPGRMNFASSGLGNANHLAMQLLLDELKLSASHVPYRGSAPANADLMGGQVQMMLDTVNTTLPLVKEGRLRALAVASTRRMSVLPNVPTVAEALLPGFEAGAWQGVWAPSATPPAVLVQVQAMVAKALATPALRDQLEGQGVQIHASSTAEFSRYYDAELKRWTDVIVKLGVKAE